MSAQHSDDAREGEQTLTIKRSRSLPRRLRLRRALAGGDDFVLGAVTNGFLELFGLLLDRAQAVLDRVVGRAEVGGDAANVDLLVVVSFACLLGWKMQNMLTLTPLAMMAATSLCQTSTESQESLPGPAMVGDVVGMDVACWVCGLMWSLLWENVRVTRWVAEYNRMQGSSRERVRGGTRARYGTKMCSPCKGREVTFSLRLLSSLLVHMQVTSPTANDSLILQSQAARVKSERNSQ
jgi:hypothetical protein